MIFSDRQIKEALAQGRFIITPPPEDGQFAPSAVDLHVGDEFKRWKTPPAGMLQQLRLSEVNIPEYASLLEDLPREDDGSAVIMPGAFVLSQTLEHITLPPNSRLFKL